MSNLNFPSTSYRSLDILLGDRAMKKIAYETHARRAGDTIQIFHHGSPIACVPSAPNEPLLVTNAGWNSRTTADRLHRIVREFNPRYSVNIRDGLMYLNRYEHPRDVKPVESFYLDGVKEVPAC